MSPPRKALPPVFSTSEFRMSLGMFATGVTIVTARTATGALVGLTANSFNSVSLEPPLVLWSLARVAGSMAAFSTGSHYVINILAADQKELAERFALRGADRWSGVAQKGLEYSEALATYEVALSQEQTRDRGARVYRSPTRIFGGARIAYTGTAMR